MSRIEEALNKASRLRDQVSVSSHPMKPVSVPSVVKENLSAGSVCIDRDVLNANPFLVTINDPHSPVAEEYRKLKSVLVKTTKSGDKFNNTLLVTSSVASEGKSVTAINLAVSFAQEHDHTVLLIDGDLRRPTVHRHLGLPRSPGLVDCLRGGCDFSEIIIPTGIGRLSVVPAGDEVRNPVELFSSQRMKNLVSELKYRYHDRYIIFDTPPVLPFAESSFLSNLVDGVLFVVKEGAVSAVNVKEALESLRGATVHGIVYNDALIDKGDDRYAYYRGYYK